MGSSGRFLPLEQRDSWQIYIYIYTHIYIYIHTDVGTEIDKTINTEIDR